jgi:hypothetical protein
MAIIIRNLSARRKEPTPPRNKFMSLLPFSLFSCPSFFLLGLSFLTFASIFIPLPSVLSFCCLFLLSPLFLFSYPSFLLPFSSASLSIHYPLFLSLCHLFSPSAIFPSLASHSYVHLCSSFVFFLFLLISILCPLCCRLCPGHLSFPSATLSFSLTLLTLYSACLQYLSPAPFLSFFLFLFSFFTYLLLCSYLLYHSSSDFSFAFSHRPKAELGSIMGACALRPTQEVNGLSRGQSGVSHPRVIQPLIRQQFHTQPPHTVGCVGLARRSVNKL